MSESKIITGFAQCGVCRERVGEYSDGKWNIDALKKHRINHPTHKEFRWGWQ